MRSVIGLAVLGVLLASGPALAKRHHKRHAHVQPIYRSTTIATPHFAAPAMCQPLCAMDTSPCDPPEFKRADNRCGNPIAGIPSY